MKPIPSVLKNILNERYAAATKPSRDEQSGSADPDIPRGEFNISDPDLPVSKPLPYTPTDYYPSYFPVWNKSTTSGNEPVKGTLSSTLKLKVPELVDTIKDLPPYVKSIPYLGADMALGIAAGNKAHEVLEPKIGRIASIPPAFAAASAAPAVALDAPLAAANAIGRGLGAGEILSTASSAGVQGFIGRMLHPLTLQLMAGQIQGQLAGENEYRRAVEMNDLISNTEKQYKTQKLIDQAKGIEKPDESYEPWYWKSLKSILMTPPRPTGMEF
jgi:hypothetical protein